MRSYRKIAIIFLLVSSIICFIFCVSCNNKKKTAIRIGIVDSYISPELLDSKNIKNIDFSNSEENTENIHGLLTLQLILDECKNSEIYYASALNEQNVGDINSIVSSIEWCINQDVDIICMSFATVYNSKELENIISLAIEKEIIIVSSCINFSDTECYPAMYENVISVSEGANNDARVILPNKKFSVNVNKKTIDTNGTSVLSAYVTGYISNQLYKGNLDIDKILNEIN